MKQRDKVVNNVKMLLGIKEGSKEHKMIIDTFNKSKLCTRYQMTTQDAWCATTVSYAFIASKLAGKPGSGSVFECVECSCGEMLKLAKKQGIFIEKDNYVPSKGDVIFYDWDDNGKGDNTGWPDHVGIVETVEDGFIKVIEGNKDDAIGRRELLINGRYVRGFLAPKYTDEKKVKYFKKYTGDSNSIVDALKLIGIVSPTFLYRRKIAAANNITAYIGTAKQNTKMLNLLKAGKLIMP